MKVVFFPTAWEDHRHWQDHDPKLLARLDTLIEECRRHPFKGTGKPEPLGGILTGWLSRRINAEHRMIYRVAGKSDAQALEIAQCRYHY